ncbi:unnamed protein product [Ranitomeya imitator]|uniref:Latent-transforming growth factor beta-binding protein 4 n=1 Tax=Ranitomeya imitator TaxID=111125 RepID=A0ABN9M3Q9_9NEOB|nr:unnamed protein product [Ranitomeya imitator]
MSREPQEEQCQDCWNSTGVAKTIKHYKETGSHEDRCRKGRPRVTSASEDKFIRVTSLRNCRLTAAQIRDQVNATQNSSRRHISTTTVKRRLCAAAFMDNDPKHTSRLWKGYLTQKESDGGLRQMTWPPQSPDLNPIRWFVYFDASFKKLCPKEQNWGAVVCPLLCKNGGVCFKKDKCLCPPNFTGKFCEIPLSASPGIAAYTIRNSSLDQNVKTYTLPLSNHQPEKDGGASIVNVHVKHPPEASVNIHQVERVDSRDGLANADRRVFSRAPENGVPVYRIQAQSSPRNNGYTENSGYGYCFRRLENGQCGSPVPGLRTQDTCCRGTGVAWGVYDCTPCPVLNGESTSGSLSQSPCPKGFERINGTCVEGFKETCPAGPGYHYSASDLKINHRFVGQDRVPVQRQPGSRILTLTTPVPPPKPVTSRFIAEERKPESDQTRAYIPPQSPDRTQIQINRSPSVIQRLFPTRSPSLVERIETEVESPPQEVNLCELNPQICGPGRCQPRPGSYTCVCNNGYWLSTQGTHCIDMDECRQRPSPCTNGRCENTVGSYRCACSAGFRTNPQGTECTDIDECNSGQQLCSNGRCENTPGSYRCVCPSGFSLNAQGNTCVDIDECRLTPRRLCLNGRCENTPGSYQCVCPAGFTANSQGTDCQDIDECRQTPRPCGSGRCLNTPGSFRCSCPAGYRLTAQGSDCIDINECENPGACAGQECVNTPGSFQCRQCHAGYRLQNRRCVDINECLTESSCGSNGKCINTDGSYQCECAPGFRLSSDKTQCTDINECLEGDFCFPRGECQNTEGSYRCVCAEGYVTTPDGSSCIDKDECQTGIFCQGGRCTNTVGSFQCACPTGLRATSDNSNCIDINECQERGAALCGTQTCENTLGSYRCIASCDSGYRLTASGDCADINECANNSTICGDNAVCENLIGTYRCTCNWGHEMSSEGQHCVDIDECLEYGDSICGSLRCQNTAGSYKCISDCEPGYQLSSSGDCTDIDECLNKTVCGEHALCLNLAGAYQCLCDQGYEGRGAISAVWMLTSVRHYKRYAGRPYVRTWKDPSSASVLTAMKSLTQCSETRPAYPSNTALTRVEFVATPGLKECYYNLEDPNVCDNVLSRNVSQIECCCTVGKGWGQACQIQKCPSMESAEYRRLCPDGVGYIASGQGSKDVDECKLFGPELCKGGVCLNKDPLFACYCSNGYYYDVHQMECVDNDECQEEDVCEGGNCINTVGSYFCTCNPPLVLDTTLRRCITNTSQAAENTVALCWRTVGADLVCKRLLMERQTTYTECCCLYGEAWGMNCALCPARDSDDFEALCNGLRSPYDYGSEYGPGYGVPYGADSFANPAPGIVRPGYEAYPAPPGVGFGSRVQPPYGPRDSVYSLPPFESPDFESDLSYPDTGLDEPGPPFRRPEPPYDPRLRPSPPHRYEQFEGLQAEECGILNGCENGRCIRVPEGYTCDCYDGYRLDMTRMACIDVNECDEAEDLTLLCLNGQCRNTEGSYECVCPRGFVMSRQHNYCVPSQE